MPARPVPAGGLTVVAGRIPAVGQVGTAGAAVDLGGASLCPGFVDLHVHGGDGADFMDGPAEAFRAVCRCHARHGTTSLTPTSTVARVADYTRFLELCGELYGGGPRGGPRGRGPLFGPHFAPPPPGGPPRP